MSTRRTGSRPVGHSGRSVFMGEGLRMSGSMIDMDIVKTSEMTIGTLYDVGC